MWKPGFTKPSNSNKKHPKDKNSKKNLDMDGPAAEIPNHVDEDDDNGGPSTPSAVAATSQKKLSGATMNMRFMTRKKETHSNSKNHQQQHHSPYQSPPTTQSPGNSKLQSENDPMQIDTEDSAPAMSPFLQQHSYPHALRAVEDAPIDMTPATTSDMYGISVDIIGRRSFGGFNRSIENTWKASYRTHKEDGNHRSSSSNNASQDQKVSDEELLARYANLVKNRNGKEDTSRKPVGNLGDKVRPRKKMSDVKRSGEKRKHR